LSELGVLTAFVHH